MTSKKFSSIIENLGDKYIMEAYECAQSYKKKKAVVQKQWIALAACVVLIVAAFPIGIAIKNGVGNDAVGTGPVTTEPVNVTEPNANNNHVHLWGAWEIITRPTDTQTGLKVRNCECGAEEEAEIYYQAEYCLAYEVNEDGKTCTVTGIGTYQSQDLYIGDEINGYIVTRIGKRAFQKTDITALTIPNTVTVIEEGAFDHCLILRTVYLPTSITEYKKDAFNDCYLLNTVRFRGSLEEWCNLNFENMNASPASNGADLYFNGSLITSVTIPEGATALKDYVFYKCNIESISIPGSVTKVGKKSLESYTIKNINFGGTKAEWKELHKDYHLWNYFIPQNIIVQCSDGSFPE